MRKQIYFQRIFIRGCRLVEERDTFVLASRKYRRRNEHTDRWKMCFQSSHTGLPTEKLGRDKKENEVVIMRRFFRPPLRKRGRFSAVYADEIGIIVIELGILINASL